MTGLRRSFPGGWSGCVRRLAAAGSLCATLAGAQSSGKSFEKEWAQAQTGREAFDAEPVGQHTKAEYAGVMASFRAIYHGNPGDLYAPRAVNAVAELLAAEGREFKDHKALHDAAGQYEFLARNYPQSSLSAPGLAKALELLGPDAADDPAQAAKVRGVLEAQYPRSAAAHGAGDVGVVTGRPVVPGGGATEASPGPAKELTSRVAAADSVAGDAADDQRHVPGAAPAMVTGIRHWSTSSYTRVAIDLGGEVEFKAARVEHPDRIFFDLHGAKLAPGLAGKSFAIVDDGFLKNIRAGQFGSDVTRIVLDVQPVAEYSAFLLPNPTRLIIDVHGRPGAEATRASAPGPGADARTGVASPGEEGADGTSGAQSAAPVERSMPSLSRSEGTGASSLPPMPVTDGSASFGLPARRDQAVTLSAAKVARPRVVVTASPTLAKPVPNSVTSTVPRESREVAAVSEGPGVIPATATPTSRPVVDKARSSSKGQGGSRRSRESAEQADLGVPAVPPPPTADGQSTLMRALGLKIGRIVIDAGHGGHDSGTLGPEGVEEKDVVLDVALRLGKLLHDRLGAEVVYTRADDTFIPLETRTAIANKAQADLFISVHANSSSDPSARGVEVYYLNFTSDPEAMQVASRENAVSSQRVNQLSDLVKKIALKDKIDESRELAADVDASLYAGLKRGNEGLKDRGVKKAPFVVLIGANMPSILAEISFVTNREDAGELRRPEYRERVAESLYKGVASYAGAINQGGRSKSKVMERAER